MLEKNEFIVPENASITEINAVLAQAISASASPDVISNIANKLTGAATEVQDKEDERTRLANLKIIVANNPYGDKATEILISRNMTLELKDELAPLDEVVKFLKIYGLKDDAGGSRICVSTKELNKCQKLLDSGRTLESIKHDEVVEKKKDNAAGSVDAGTKEETGSAGDGETAKTGEATGKHEPSTPNQA